MWEAAERHPTGGVTPGGVTPGGVTPGGVTPGVVVACSIWQQRMTRRLKQAWVTR